jgi:hypothetical protein
MQMSARAIKDFISDPVRPFKFALVLLAFMQS